MKSKKNLTRFTYETTAFQGWRLCIARAGSTFTRYFSDKQCGGPRKALKAAEAKLGELKEFLDGAPRREGKLTKTAEAKARKILKVGVGGEEEHPAGDGCFFLGVRCVAERNSLFGKALQQAGVSGGLLSVCPKERSIAIRSWNNFASARASARNRWRTVSLATASRRITLIAPRCPAGRGAPCRCGHS